MPNTPLAILLCLLIAAVPAIAGTAPATPAAIPTAPTITTPTGAYDLAYVTFTGGGGSVPAVLGVRDGKLVQAWFHGQAFPGWAKPIGMPKLLVDAARGSLNAGELEVRLTSVWTPVTNVAQTTLMLTLARNGSQITGTYASSDGKLTGQVSGTYLTEDAARTAQVLATDQAWTSFYGIAGGMRGNDQKKPLITDLSKARMQWKSEYRGLSGWGTGAGGSYKHRAGVGCLNGGASTPVGADGLVYSYSYFPSGDVTLPDDDKSMQSNKGFPAALAMQRLYPSNRADVVVTCIDGATGKTVWQSVWPQKQGNFQGHKWRGLNPTPSIGGGYIAVVDYSWGLHVHNAKTGALAWSVGGGGPVVGNSSSNGAIIIGDVVVLTRPDATIGYDLASGKERWKTPGGMSARPCIIAGKPRVLVWGATPSLVDPVAGKALWTSDVVTKSNTGMRLGMPHENAMPIVEDGVLYMQNTTEVNSNKTCFAKVAAYTVSDASLTPLWTSADAGPVEDNEMTFSVAGGLVFAAYQDAMRIFDVKTGATVQTIPEAKGGSNNNVISAGDWVLFQPECQHGNQHVHLLQAVAGKAVLHGQQWTPPHNVTTAYGNMAMSNILVDGRFICRGIDAIYCYDLRAP